MSPGDLARWGFRLWVLTFSAFVGLRWAGMIFTPWWIVMSPLWVPATIIAGFFLAALVWLAVLIAVWWLP